MQILDHCKHSFVHAAPVLRCAVISFDDEKYFTLTKNCIYFWFRNQIEGMAPSEADYDHYEYRANGCEFTDMVVVSGCAIVSTSLGTLQIYYIYKQSVERLDEEIVSKQGSKILDICYCHDILFVLHEGGWLNRFFEFGVPDNADRPNFKRFLTERNIPLFLGAKNVATIEPFWDETSKTMFLFITEQTCVRVYTVCQKGAFEMVRLVGFLSEQLAKKDISAIDTTKICAQDGIIMLGNKTGNTACWEMISQEEDTLGQRTTARISFKHVTAAWWHGTQITALQLSVPNMLCFSFDKDGCCVVTDLKKNVTVSKFIPHAKAVTSAELNITKGLMLTTSEDYTAKLWRICIPTQRKQ